MDGLDVVTRAHELLSEYGWTRGEFARNADGKRVAPMREEAVSFCMAGALWRAAEELGGFDGRYSAARKLIADAIGLSEVSLSYWNDTVGEETVLETLAGIVNKKEALV